jgi:hypothetical protein
MTPDESFSAGWSARMTELLQDRQALPQDDLEYVVERVQSLKDERLKACVAELIGWGDEERAEVETFVAISLELMKGSKPAAIRNAARVVYTRKLINQKAQS